MITLSEERKESRRANDELWDKKFTVLLLDNHQKFAIQSEC